MKTISIPQTAEQREWWAGTTGVQCECGGSIEWAEGAYTTGCRACRSCLALYSVRGSGADRRLVPQANHDGIIEDADEGDDIYRVPKNLYPGWHQPAAK